MKKIWLYIFAVLVSLLLSCTGFNEAIIKGDVVHVKKLILNGEDINKRDKDGNTPLLVAVKNENAEIVKTLVDANADVKIKDSDGNTPLINAVVKGNEEIVKMLLDAKSDINARDKNENTPLLIASGKGYPKIVKMLIEAGAEITDVTNKYDMNALILSFNEINNPEVNNLLEKYFKRPKVDTLVVVMDKIHYITGNYEIKVSVDIFGGGNSSMAYTVKGQNILYYFCSTTNELSEKVIKAGIKIQSGELYLLKKGSSLSSLKYISSLKRLKFIKLFTDKKKQEVNIIPVIARYYGITHYDNGIYSNR